MKQRIDIFFCKLKSLKNNNIKMNRFQQQY